MTLRLRPVLRNGLDRAFRRNGLLLIVAYLLLTLLQAGFVWMVTTTALPLGVPSGAATSGGMPDPGSQLPPVVSLSAVLVASFTGGVLTVPLSVVVHRTLVSPHTERVPEEFCFHRLGWATLESFVGSWLVSGVVIGIGGVALALAGWALTSFVGDTTLLTLVGSWPGRALLAGAVLVLLLPAAFVGIGLVFVTQEVAVKDKHLHHAIAGSWRLARGNRLRLLALVLVPVVVQFLVSFGIFQSLSPMQAQVVSLVESAVLQIVIFAVMARAYVGCHDGEPFTDGVVEPRTSPSSGP